MNKIISKIKYKNIQDLYNIENITENGQISIKDKVIVIYKIDPANIVACDEETKYKIYQAYLSCVRGLPDNFQIMISKESADFTEQIKLYNKRLSQIDNESLKLAIKKYITYLENLTSINKLYRTSHYLMVENINTNEVEEIINIFSNLEEFGVRITQIKSKEQAKNILKKFIIKEK